MTRARDLAAFVSNADGDIKFDTDTLFIDSSANKVGIGTTSPASALHLESDTPVITLRDDSAYSVGTGPYVQFQGLDSGSTNRNFGQIYGLSNGSNSGELAFHTRNSGTSAERIRILSSGGLKVNQGAQIATTPSSEANFYSGIGFKNLSSDHAFSIGYGQGGVLTFNHFDNDSTYTRLATLSSAGLFEPQGDIKLQDGKGISFSATGQPSGMTSELLNDYEEGTWTPACTGSLSVAGARYVKVGNLVNASLYITSLNPTADNNTFKITGLPYAVKTSGGYYVGGSIGYTGDNNLNDVTVLTGTALDFLYFHLNDGDSGSVTGNDMRTRGMTGASLDALIISISYCTS